MADVPGVLGKILERKREEVKALRRRLSLRDLEDAAREAPPARPLIAPIAAVDGERPALIAEFKRASPSKGLFDGAADPAIRARLYARAGATAMSVLTDEAFFRGSLEDLERARRATDLPVLRKDFVIDPAQLFEARAAGADAALLIVAALGSDQLEELVAAAAEIGLDALVEVHRGGELDRALARGAPLIGINNRDLVTFETTLETTLTLAPGVPREVPVVAESGIATRDDVRRVLEAGARGVLVGEALMRAADPRRAILELLGDDPDAPEPSDEDEVDEGAA